MNILKWLVGFISLAFLCSCATIDPWTKEQKTLYVMYTVLQTIDFGQTLDIADNPGEYEEINPLIGKHPSRGRVIKYFATSWIGKTVIANLLWGKWRTWFLTGNIVVSGYLVNHNYKIGLRVAF